MTLLDGVHLSPAYERAYARLIDRVAADPRISPRETSLFWPKVGRKYDGDLLLVGRAVNGWIDRWDLDESGGSRQIAATARGTAEDGVNGCPMGWVLDRWKRGDEEYDTSRSQFWVTAREVTVAGYPERQTDWPSHLAWSNLAKVSRWTKGNPSWRLRQAQLPAATELLALEVEELAPRRVLVLAGREWFEPYARALGLVCEWRQGLVEGAAHDGDRHWVIAVHPMTRSPRAVAVASVAAFGSSSR
jgi:hypothetical protein